MKKLLIGILLLLAVAGGALFFVASNLDGIVKRAIETAGTDVLGTPVRVDAVSIDLTGGSATLSGFSISNPAGFSNQDMIRFDELSMAIDIRSLTSDVIRINSIRSVNPYVLYEMQGLRGNLNAVLDRFPAQTAPPAEPTGPEPVIGINEITINGIQGSLQSDQLTRPVDVNLGNVAIPAVEGTPEQLARQIARPLLTQLARNAANAMTSATAAAVEAELRQRADEATEQLRSEAEESVEGAVQGLRDRLRLEL